MNGPFHLYEAYSLRLAQTLLYFLWQGAAIGVIAGLLERMFFRATAQAKYMLQVGSLTLMVACLPVTFLWLDSPNPPGTSPARNDVVLVRMQEARSWPTSAERLAADPEPVSLGTTINGETEEGPAAPLTDASVGVATVPGSPAPQSKDALRPESPIDVRPAWSAVAPIVCIFYVACVTAMLFRLAGALRGGNQLNAASTPVTERWILASLARQANNLKLRALPVVARCEQVSIPIVVGILRPAILLPGSLVSGLSPTQLEAVIAHELAHIRRYDPLVNLFQRFVEAVAFFHPATWYVSRRIDVHREHAADDLVLSAGWNSVRYADALVRMAELSKQLRSSKTRLALAASGSDESEFKRRVLRLLAGAESSSVRLTHAGLTALLALTACLLLAPLALQAFAQRSETSSDDVSENVGRRIADFSLQDFRGRRLALSDHQDEQLVVVAFLGTECPLAKLYGKRLNDLSREYESRGVAFVGINSNQQDTPTELAHYARRHEITFPLLKDPSNQVADQFRAARTPEVFLLDDQRVIRYWGRIDDQFGVGYAKPEAKRSYLQDAIDDLLAGREVALPKTEAVGCHIARVQRTAPSGDISYTSHIARVMEDRCVECHREGGIAPFALRTYEDVAAWSETIVEVVEDQRMPPWHANPDHGHFLNDARMPEEEQRLLRTWVENGVPRGAGDPPSRREFSEGWLLGRPDLVLRMPTPVEVPATGVVDYQYVEIDPGFKEGRWVRASEIRPGVRSVVHHLIVFINPPGGDPILERLGFGFESVGGYVPGAGPMQLQAGVARYVPAGSTLVFQIHYTPDGTNRRDQSEIGLYFADPRTVKRTMQTGVVAELNFNIPAGAREHQVVAQHRFSHDMELHSLAPHMHFRGKAFRYEAIYPHGAKEVLLDVPNYDFNWQHVYQLATPRLMPEGTLLKCTAVYDNSEHNLANPDPTIAVRWGEQTWEEMMVGYFDGVFLNQDMTAPEPTVTETADDKFRVHFRFKPDRPAKSVHLAGTFNEWSLHSHPLSDDDGDGVYTVDLDVEEGEYRYKFVIDGNYWTHDPASRVLTGFLHESFFVARKDR